MKFFKIKNQRQTCLEILMAKEEKRRVLRLTDSPVMQLEAVNPQGIKQAGVSFVQNLVNIQMSQMGLS